MNGPNQVGSSIITDGWAERQAAEEKQEGYQFRQRSGTGLPASGTPKGLSLLSDVAQIFDVADKPVPSSGNGLHVRGTSAESESACRDAEDRGRYALHLAEGLAEFERPVPVMDEYDQLLSDTGG